MGYNIKISGQIKFEPRIVGSLAATALESAKFEHVRRDGLLQSDAITTTGLEKPDEDELLEDVQALVEVVTLLSNDAATFSGYLECQGEEAGDLWRVYVRNGQAVRVDPKIVWPDEP